MRLAIILAAALAISLSGCVIRDIRAECEGTHQPAYC